jgi:hypothetical protein
MSNKLSRGSLPDELPADWVDFDDELPDELPASFIDFDEDRLSNPSVSKARPSSMPQLSKVTPVGSRSSHLLHSPQLEQRNLVMAFVQTMDATVTHVIPRGMPDPVFPRGAAHDWDTWRRERNDRMFTAARGAIGRKSFYGLMQGVEEETKRERQERKDWLDGQRRIARGWACWLRWRSMDPQAADAYRREGADADGCDLAWLMEFKSVRLPSASKRVRGEKARHNRKGAHR